MKIIIGLLCVLLIGCAAGKLPEYPTFRQIVVYPVEDGICVDAGNLKIWMDNIKLLKNHCNEMRQLLEKEGYKDD